MAVTLVQGVTSASAGENSTAETKCYFYVPSVPPHPALMIFIVCDYVKT